MTENKKNAGDISKVGIPLIRANMTESQFKEWCTKHGWTGNITKAYADLRKKAGKTEVKVSKEK